MPEKQFTVGLQQLEDGFYVSDSLVVVGIQLTDAEFQRLRKECNGQETPGLTARDLITCALQEIDEHDIDHDAIEDAVRRVMH